MIKFSGVKEKNNCIMVDGWLIYKGELADGEDISRSWETELDRPGLLSLHR